VLQCWYLETAARSKTLYEHTHT